MRVCRRFRVSGMVQGVGYRFAACDEARRLALTGWVRNRADGGVETLACGEADQVRAFERWLWQGPRAARVTAVRAVDAPPEALDGFEIR